MFISYPEISIILLTYNRPEGLRKAVESIYSQTFKKFELIILDNGSAKDYEESIEDYIISKDNLRYIRFEDNTSCLGYRLNQGLSVSNGKYICFLMDDDSWLPDSLKILHTEIDKGFDFIYGKVRSYDHTTGKQVSNSFSHTDWKLGIRKRLNPIHITSTIIRKDLFDRIGGFHDKIKRFYELDLWNRIFVNSKVRRIEKIISNITVNNLSSVTGKNRADLNTPIDKYPLVGYWSKRKSLSLIGDERKFISAFNQRNQPWIITGNNLKTDACVFWTESRESQEYFGDRFYYIDHPMVVLPSFIEKCRGTITQYSFESNKPNHILRPTISHETLRKTDNIFYHYLNNIRILCPKITEGNLDFIRILLEYVADRYGAVYFYYFLDTEIRAVLKEIPNLILVELLEDSYDHYKSHSVDAVLHVEGDSNSYIDAYKSFLISSAVRAPLVTSPNIAFESILEHGKDLFIVDKIQSFVTSLDKAKRIDIRERMIRNIRKKTYLYFLDQIVYDKLTFFLNENFSSVSKYISYQDISTAQLKNDSEVILHKNEDISQTFISKTDSFNAIQFYGDFLNNSEDLIIFTLKRGEEVLFTKEIPNCLLKKGENTVLFDDIKNARNQEYRITFCAGDSPIFKLFYNKAVMKEGVYYTNNIPKRACLKFKVLKGADYVIS